MGHQFPALATLEKLIKQGALSNIALVIVDRAHGSELPETLKHYIAANDLLEAVIDLPSQDVSGTRTVFTAWLLNTDKMNSNETLCIDATRLEGAGYFEPTWLAAAVVERWRSPHYKIDSKFFKEFLDSNLNESFLKHLENEYRNLPGFCRALFTDTVLNAPELTAREHLGHEENNLKLNSPENRPLLDILTEETTGPTCSYIIGNNGAGKSLLLRDLIKDLDQENLTSIGIAFGAIDRFPLESSRGSLFIYQGARRDADDLHQLEFLHRLSEALLDIYQSPSRLEIFTEALDFLDFNHIHYLVPISDPDNPIDNWERGISSFELHEDVQVPMEGERYEPGIQPKEVEFPVLPLSEMNSGEQQVLSLLIRICANADVHTVFLIDEPEISLHVSWQQRLPQLLSRIAKEFECSFVVATHSPILITNARDAISHCFLAENKKLRPIPAHQRHSVESILLDGFKTYTPDNREINER
ncbi:hypothetical protein BKX96_08945 [Pseudomonas putida]|nr:hypothetical protein BKX96_08945 [Pseudomonas putida]